MVDANSNQKQQSDGEKPRSVEGVKNQLLMAFGGAAVTIVLTLVYLYSVPITALRDLKTEISSLIVGIEEVKSNMPTCADIERVWDGLAFLTDDASTASLTSSRSGCRSTAATDQRA